MEDPLYCERYIYIYYIINPCTYLLINIFLCGKNLLINIERIVGRNVTSVALDMSGTTRYSS